MNWTKEERINFNKACATFCGYKYYPHNYEGIIPTGRAGWQKEAKGMGNYNDKLKLGGYLCRHDKDLSFNYDWNRIHEVIEKINNSKKTAPMNGISDSIMPYIEEKRRIVRALLDNDKEAIVQAINQFLIWYNLNNK